MKIIKKILEFYHGWKNYFFRIDSIEILSKERLIECEKCEFYKLYVCTRCSCPGAGKSRSPESKCPENKWKDGWFILEDNNEIQSIMKLIKENPDEFNTQEWIFDKEVDKYITEEEYNKKYNNNFPIITPYEKIE